MVQLNTEMGVVLVVAHAGCVVVKFIAFLTAQSCLTVILSVCLAIDNAEAAWGMSLGEAPGGGD